MESAVVRQLLPDLAPGSALAACSYFHDFGTLPDAYCLRADPVHLQADTHGLVMLDCSVLQISEVESHGLAETVSEHLAEDGWRLKMGDACRWYLLGDDQDLRSPPPDELVGRHASLSALQGADAGLWMRRLNEIQMLLNGSEFSRQRLEERRKPVNSLCLWGGGRLQPVTGPVYDILVSAHNPVVEGAAEVAGTRLLSCEQASGLLGQTGKNLDALVTLERCRQTGAGQGDLSVWIEALHDLEKHWFGPLLAAWNRQRIDVLELHPLNGRVYRLEPSTRWKIWRRSTDYRKRSDFVRESVS